MIRRASSEDYNKIMEIWKEANITTHDFIDLGYWLGNYENVRDNYLPISDTYILEIGEEVKGFISLIDSTYIGGLFCSVHNQGKGYGTKLLNFVKERYPFLELAVYDKNLKAIEFYQKNGFDFVKSQIEEDTGELEYIMKWER